MCIETYKKIILYVLITNKLYIYSKIGLYILGTGQGKMDG